MFKKALFSLFVLSFIIAPLALNAQSADDIARMIADLQRQIAVLKQQLAHLQGQQSGQWCFTFEKNLGVGVKSGSDISALREVLSKEGFYVPDKSLIYNESTAAAVSAFQLKYAKEILAPLGLANPTGYVGPSTRAVLNRLYGCAKPPIIGNRPPTISGVSGPTTLKIGETGTWTVQASDPENGPLSYSVIWGDEEAYADVFGGVPLSSLTYSQTATFTHVYTRIANPNGTTYTPAFFVKDNAGQSNRTSLSVTVGGTNTENRASIGPVSLIPGQVGQVYKYPFGEQLSVFNLEIQDDLSDVTQWAVINGSLPPGLELKKTLSRRAIDSLHPLGYEVDNNLAYITGTPTIAGTYTFIIKASNNHGFATKSYNLIIVKQDEQLVVPKYSVVITPTNNGQISLTPLGPYERGSAITVVAIPNSGYKLARWTGYFADTPNVSPRVLRISSENVTLGAEFEPL